MLCMIAIFLGGFMKLLKKIISYFCVILIITLLFNGISFKSYATVPSSQIVTGHSGSWGSYDFYYSFHYHYYKIEDATGIPSSTLLNAQYFYTKDGVTFGALSSADLFMLVLNRGIGPIACKNA